MQVDIPIQNMLEPIIKYVYCSKCYFLILFIYWNFVSSEQILPEVTTHPNWKLLNLGTKCGRNTQFRIIGGEEASLGEYPWIARLGYLYELGIGEDLYVYQCGGTIISDRYILSAAHCSSEVVGYELATVRLGEHDDRRNPDCLGSVCAPPVQDIRIEEYSCHPGFDIISLHDDICLIRLSKTIQFNRYVAPICLPVYEYLKMGNFNKNMMEVAGWGVTDIYTMKSGDVLMKLKVPMKNNTECVKKYTGRAVIVPTQLCAGGVVGKDSCGGDSGGPLMGVSSVGGRPRYFIIGIVSFGPKYCAQSDTPGIYTNVVDYLPWILDHIRE